MENEFTEGEILDVAPFVGAWIEIGISRKARKTETSSLPSWERGLKSRLISSLPASNPVAPFVGAWIEIFAAALAWALSLLSLPSWERGLK